MLDLPYLPQSVQLCGGAAAAMVQRYWGEATAEPTDFAGLVRPDEGGIRTDELTAELRERGWRTRRLQGGLDALADQIRDGRPVIVLLRVGADRYHYVVVVAVTGSSVLVHDPARSPFLRLSRAAFVQEWDPTDRWALLLLPAGSGDAEEDGDGGERRPPGRPIPADDPEAPCGEAVAAAVGAAREGRTGRADSLITDAVRRCPERARVHAELAGVRFLQERWREAARSARRALDRDPEDAHALRILAASRYLLQDDPGALRAWNRLDEPRLTGLRVYGLRATRYETLRRHLGTRPGRLLTPGTLAAVRRRAASVPAFRSARVGLRAPVEGRAELEVAVLERSSAPTSPTGLAPVLARAVTDRELRVELGALAGGGETWTGTLRWWENRPRVSARLAAPGAFGVAGVWTAGGAWERETFAVDGDPVREERSRAAIGVSRWWTGHVRLSGGASLDRWEHLGSRLGLRAALELRGARDRVAIRAGARGWQGGGPAFGGLGVAAAARTDPEAAWRLRARAGLAAVTADAPRTLWPGAGVGVARPTLLRAHPLLREGVVAGPAFGRRLGHAGIELDRALPAGDPLSTRAGVFVDLARPWETGQVGAPRFQADVGIGLEAGAPGVDGRLRLEYARGLRDGADALTLRWAPAWPGW